jgi:secreted trypsin-like serine protease
LNILLAAHCILQKFSPKEKQPSELVLLFGAHNLTNCLQPGRDVKTVSKIFVHDGWNPLGERYNDDIAVILLESNVTFSRYISPICISNENSTRNDDEFVIAGWGKKEGSRRDHEEIPTKITLSIEERADCYEKIEEFSKIGSKNMFCAGAEDVKVCSGDSGSGLVIPVGGSYFLKGILSVSKTDISGCSGEKLALYTDVTKYFEFIEFIDQGNWNLFIDQSC